LFHWNIKFSVSVGFVLEWTGGWDIDIISLLLGEFRKLGTKGWKMEHSDLLVELLW